MNLLVDVGNTKTKWKFDWPLNGASIKSIMNSELSASYLEKEFLDLQVDAIVISCVGNEEIRNQFEHLARFKKCLIFVAATEPVMCGIKMIYQDINRLGVDRALAMIAAYNKDAVLVVDAGSALTADFVNAQGEHLGGFILPGLGMSRAALLGNTANINAGSEYSGIGLGFNTDTCVNNGNAFMYKQLILGLVDEAKKRGIKRFVFTGGDASKLLDYSNVKADFEENLVLEGLALFLKEKLNDQKVLGE